MITINKNIKVFFCGSKKYSSKIFVILSLTNDKNIIYLEIFHKKT